MKATDLVYVKTTVRKINNAGQVVPVNLTEAKFKRNPHTDEEVMTSPAVPLVQMAGPYTREIANGFMAGRKEHSPYSPTTWEIVEAADVNKHTDVTKTLVNQL